MIVNKKRFFLVSLIIIGLAAYFWSGSRYPSLNQKALMGGDAHLESPMSFNAVIEMQPGDSVALRITDTFINWAAENRVGMTFGICFGAALVTLFQLLKQRGTSSSMLNAVIGLGTGVPLGVCVNCSAPIARGLHAAGARLEMTLATMFSSPTLNVIALTMVFSMFPLYMALIKVGLTLLFILIIVPVLAKFVFPGVQAPTYDDTSCEWQGAPVPQQEHWLQAVTEVVRTYLKNLWFIISRTLPLMIVAGLLGALVVQIIPLEGMTGLQAGLAAGLLAAGVGIFLPMPIAFDIVLAAILFSSGLPVFYSMILLFTLGIYSIYPFLILWSSISRSLAIVLMVVLMGLGLASGYMADYFHHEEMAEFYEFLEQG